MNIYGWPWSALTYRLKTVWNLKAGGNKKKNPTFKGILSKVTVTHNNYLEYGILTCIKFDYCSLIFDLKRYLPITSVFNGNFEGDGHWLILTGDMTFKNLLLADEECAELFGVRRDSGDYTSLVAQSEFFSALHPKRINWYLSINLFSRVSLSS